MLKKFVSKALLSVVMDKSARNNLEHKRVIKQAVKAGVPPVPSGLETTPAPPPVDNDPDSLESMSHEETRQLILASLKAAEEELGSKQEVTPERQALIDQAMAVHQSKLHVLKDISEEQRQKLYVLALKSLESDPGQMVASRQNSKKKSNK